jgi:hypothetical protein
VTVVLHITRSSGTIEVHELPTKGDVVEVPNGLLSSEDVLGFDVEVPQGVPSSEDARGLKVESAGTDRCNSGGANEA